MRIAILGTGVVGRNLAGRLTEIGHKVSIGTRDPAATQSRDDYEQVAGVDLVAFADAARDADLVINASSGGATLDVLRAVGADDLAGRVLLDLANPLDFSRGFPPTLLVKDTDSLERTVAELLRDSEARQRLVQNAHAALSEHQGATTRTAALIHDLRRL